MEEGLLLNRICGHAIYQTINSGIEHSVFEFSDATEARLALMNHTSSCAEVASYTFLELGIEDCLSHHKESLHQFLCVFR